MVGVHTNLNFIQIKKAENVIKNKLYKENKNCKVDKIFRFENFDEVTSYIRNL